MTSGPILVPLAVLLAIGGLAAGKVPPGHAQDLPAATPESVGLSSERLDEATRGLQDKSRILKRFRPHIFFDDQKLHLDGATAVAPCVHVPVGR